MIKAVGAQFQNAVLDGVEGLARGQQVSDRKHDETHKLLGSIDTQLANLGAVGRDGLVALALKFGIPEAGDFSDAKLRDLLHGKAEEYASLKAQIDDIDDRVKGLGNLKAAAQDVMKRLDFEEVEALLSRVDAVESETLAETRELRARNALLRGRVDEASRHFTAAAEVFTSIDRRECARRRVRYGTELARHGVRYGGDGVSSAVTHYRAALDSQLGLQELSQIAGAQRNLAIALRTLGVRTEGASGVTLLRQAVAAYRLALESSSQSHLLESWAKTRTSMSHALLELGKRLGGGEGFQFLQEAVTACEEALPIRQQLSPREGQAVTQNALGNALKDLAVRTEGSTGIDLLCDAAVAYSAALECLSDHEGSEIWATTLNNLSIAQQNLGERIKGQTGIEFLENALSNALSSLEVRTADGHPIDSAWSNWNIAEINLKLANIGPDDTAHARLHAALRHVDDALKVFDPQHMSQHHQEAIALRARILADLDAQGAPKPPRPPTADRG